MTGVLIRREETQADTQGKGSIKTEAEIEVMRLQTKGCQDHHLPAGTGRGKESPPLQVAEGAWPC